MGLYLTSPNKEKKTTTGHSQSGNIYYVASGMQGWRIHMEDAHISKTDLIDDCSIFGVFDGHGGSEVAKFVEKHFIEELKKNNNFQNGKMADALKEVFLLMDDMLLTEEGKAEIAKLKEKESSGEQGRVEQEESQAGCTANVALIYKNELYVANAGDSRSVLFTGGKVRELSKDHKPSDEKEKQRIIKGGGVVTEDGRINGNLNLSRAIGDLEFKKNKDLQPNEQLIIAEPDITKLTLSKNDQFIVMGCDGIWEMWSVQKICEFVHEGWEKGKSGKDIIEDLLDQQVAPTTRSGVGCDNMTCILIFLNQAQK